jgi:hypothetical protein
MPYKYYLVAVRGKRHWDDEMVKWIDTREGKSFGPCDTLDLPTCLDKASSLAERLGCAVWLFQSWRKCSVSREQWLDFDTLEYHGIEPARYEYVLDADNVTRTYSITREQLETFLAEHDIVKTRRVEGDPAHDGNFAAMYDDLRERFAEDDDTDYDTLFSVTGYDKWKYLRQWGEMPIDEMFDDIWSDRTNMPDLDRFVQGHVWVNDNVGYRGGKVAQELRVSIARYGYDMKVVFGRANERDRRLNRLASIACGVPPKDYTPDDLQEHDEGVQAIATERSQGRLNFGK